MDRRSFLNQTAFAATVLATAQSKAFAEDHKNHKAMGDELTHALTHCSMAGEACLQHCIEMMSKGDTAMAECATSVREMLSLVRATRELAVQKSQFLGKTAAVCAAACENCKKVCDKFAKHPVCKACADSCAECLKECKKVA